METALGRHPGRQIECSSMWESVTPSRRLRLPLAVALGLLGAWVCTAQASSMSAHSARTLNVADEAHLRPSGNEGETLNESGTVTGALPGSLRVHLTIGATVSATFTIYPRGGGSISGRGSARLHSTGTYASFGGTMYVTHGTGGYAHAHGHGGLYGTVNRRTDALVVQTTGRLSY